MSSYLSLTQLETLPFNEFSRCLHQGIRKMTVCTFRQASRRSRSLLSVCCAREQPSVGRWWCRSVSQSLASQIWFLLSQGWRLMVPIIGMFCCHRNCCPWCVKCRERSLSFSRTAHPDTSPRYCQISGADNASVHFPRSVAPEQPDLNPVDYKIWGIVQQYIYQSRVHDVDQLKQRLLDVWHGMEQNVVDSAIDEWRVRLRACVWARGGTWTNSVTMSVTRWTGNVSNYCVKLKYDDIL